MRTLEQDGDEHSLVSQNSVSAKVKGRIGGTENSLSELGLFVGLVLILQHRVAMLEMSKLGVRHAKRVFGLWFRLYTVVEIREGFHGFRSVFNMLARSDQDYGRVFKELSRIGN